MDRLLGTHTHGLRALLVNENIRRGKDRRENKLGRVRIDLVSPPLRSDTPRSPTQRPVQSKVSLLNSRLVLGTHISLSNSVLQVYSIYIVHTRFPVGRLCTASVYSDVCTERPLQIQIDERCDDMMKVCVIG